jgi:hypothetical protein
MMSLHTLNGLTAYFNGRALVIATGQKLAPITRAQLKREQKLHQEYCAEHQLNPGTPGYESLDMVPPSPPPKFTERRVIWAKQGGGTAIVLVGYCESSLENFLGIKARIPGVDPRS